MNDRKTSNINIDEMKEFYQMLLKMKKKRPNMDINRLMRLIYKNEFDDNLNLF